MPLSAPGLIPARPPPHVGRPRRLGRSHRQRPGRNRRGGRPGTPVSATTNFRRWKGQTGRSSRHPTSQDIGSPDNAAGECLVMSRAAIDGPQVALSLRGVVHTKAPLRCNAEYPQPPPMAVATHVLGHAKCSHAASQGACSTSSTKTPPASLGWTKLIRVPAVPRCGRSYNSRSPRERNAALTASRSLTR